MLIHNIMPSTKQSSVFDYEKDTWSVIDRYYAVKTPAESQIDSYDSLIKFTIPELIVRNSPVEVSIDKKRVVVSFGKITVNKPIYQEGSSVTKVLYPREARIATSTIQHSTFSTQR